jgi:glutamine kinase
VIAPLAFGTKAETLARVAPRLTTAVVPPRVAFTLARWRADRELVLAEAASLGRRVVVRSSARGEDGPHASMAGAFVSVAGVDPTDGQALAAAIDAVAASYTKAGRAALVHDQVLVQKQVEDVAIAGVLFTADMDTLAPYYVFAYDESGATDTVTSGKEGRVGTLVRFKGARTPSREPRFAAVFALGAELEALFASPHLDVELAIDRAGTVHLLQVRRLATAGHVTAPDAAAVGEQLEKIAKKCEKLALPHPDLAGSGTAFGVMPDWNPAEMIGTKPRRLALSLYKELITDAIWAYQRDNYGYRNLRSFPLLVSLMGQPYVDVRVSFNSFVPKALDLRIAAKLVDHYLAELARRPHDHDKVEFNVVYTCAYPGLSERIQELAAHGFRPGEIDRIKFSLLALTNGIIDPARGLYMRDLAKVEELSTRHARTMASDMPLLHKIYWVVEDTKRYGTLPFAGLARAGFVAMQILKGLVALGIFTEADQAAFMQSLETVSRKMAKDALRLAAGELGREEFLATYGHLRPGTYDILSKRYDEDFDAYFSPAALPARLSELAPTSTRPFALTPAQRDALAAALVDEGFEVGPDELLAFLRGAICGREYGKFVFTRSLSDLLVLVEQLGARAGVAREELSHLDIKTLLSFYSELGADDLDQVLTADVARGKRAHAVTRALRLPHLITQPADVYEFALGVAEPNFVTLGRVRAKTVDESELGRLDPTGKVVFVRSADPGYDWLFARNIAGLVTEHGGANSHMAIRAAELGVPSVIGCGEKLYGGLSRATVIEIDCANRVVRKVA